MTMQKSNRDFDKLKSHISGREFYLAQQIIGLTDGNKRHDPEHHQPCPRSSCDSDDDAFYVREDKGTFHCRKCDFSGNLIDLVMAVKGIDAIGAYDIIADYAGFRNASNSAIVKAAQQHPKNSRQYFQDGTVRKIEFVYTNEENNPRHKVVRLDGIAVSTGKPDKIISQQKMVDGRWEKGAPDMQYPYRLPELLQTNIDEIWVGEGEKVVDALRETLLAAGVTNIAVTTSPGGTPNGKQWHKFVQRYSSILTKRFRIFPDNDEPGLKYALIVAKAILEANPEADVRFVKLPDLPEGGDFVDWHASFVANGKDESAAVETLKVYCEHPDYSIMPKQCESAEDSPKDVPEKFGIDILDSFLEQVEQVSFIDDERPSLKTYYVGSIEHLLKTAKKHLWDIGMKNEAPHFFTGQLWQRIDQRTFRHFLQAVGVRQGVPHKTIKDHLFAEKLVKQFSSEARFPVLSSSDIPKINLRNGTLHFTPNGTELKPFDQRDGLTYQLHYDYDETAIAPQFKKFLDRVLPDVAVQKLLFQYIAYIFLRNMNLEKLLFLYGGGANGKSVFLNVIRGLVGEEQCCEYSLEGITGSEYQRAELGNYLLNVSSEISTRMGKDIFKKLASREPLQARHPYGRPFTVKDYATSIFSMNEMLKDVEQTGAFFRRFLIIPFEVWIPDDEQEQDLAQRIIDSEMSGVLNYLIEGVKSLLVAGKFEIPTVIQDTVDEFRRKTDTVLDFLEENGYRPCVSTWKPLWDMYKSYREQCLDGGHCPVSQTTFAQRLRNKGYTVCKVGKKHQTVVYATLASDDSDSDYGDGGAGREDDRAAPEGYTANYDANRDRRLRRNFSESW